MKRILLASALLLATAVHADEVTHRYVVVTRWPTTIALPTILRDDLAPRAGRAVREWDIINGFAADLTDADVAQLRQSRQVAYVEPVVERHLMAFRSRPATLSDAVVAGQETIPYGVSLVNAPQVWPAGRGAARTTGTPTHVAIIDTGIDYKHPELAHAYKEGFNLINNTTDPLDDDGHGTHVAGTIAAANDSNGVVGIASDADIYSVKVLDACGSSTTNDALITAMQWVVGKKKTVGGNWVVNLSLGGGNPSSAEAAAFQAAADAGILTFAASGNSYDPQNPTLDVAYPGAYASVVAVGAVDSTTKVADFSQRGPALKLVGPGVDVLSTIVSEKLSTSDGHNYLGAIPSAKLGTRSLCLANPSISGSFVFCGFGGDLTEFPPSVAGKIALISRGNGVTFVTKMTNAKAAGAKAAVVYNNQGEALVSMDLQTVTTTSALIPMIFIAQSSGEAIKATPNVTLTTGFGLEGYTNFDGTSMSTPHAAGVAALVWSLAPTASRADVLDALLTTARDLGDPGVDNTYGYGLVNAYGAAAKLAPTAIPLPSLSGRKVLRRGH